MNNRHCNTKHGSRGFTLIEVLVIIGIIVLLVSIALPSLQAVRRSAKVQASRARLALIETACDAYYQDFHLYPESKPNKGWEGRHMLVQALTGYLPDPNGEAKANNSGDFVDDDAEGFGFRTKKPGKVYGPYAGAENLELDGASPKSFVDTFGNQIFYYAFRDKKYDGADNTDGPKIDQFAKSGQDGSGKDVYFRTNFLLISKGGDLKWHTEKSNFDWRDPENDDITNFLPEQ